LVGGGTAVDDVQRLAERMGVADRIDFIGYLRGDALVSAYQGAAATVLPSVTESEAFGMTLIEAMACGSPVIGSAVGGISNVIDHGVTGLLVPAGDPGALSAACIALLTDGARARQMGDRGAVEAQARFGWDQRLEEYLALFRSWLD